MGKVSNPLSPSFPKLAGLITLLGLSTTVSLSALATHPNCTIDVNDPTVPECPESGLLDDRYPASVMLLGHEGDATFRTVKSALEKIIATEQKPPLLLINTTDANYAKIIDLILKTTKKEDHKKWLSSIRLVKSRRYNWNQDYFQSYVDPNTGKPFLREVLPYRRAYHKKPGGEKELAAASDVFKDVSKMMSTLCNIPVGEGIDIPGNRDVYGGYAGGNIEGAPGNLCFLGDNGMPDDIRSAYAQSACPAASTPIKVPTHWLGVGHTDEVVTTVRTKDPAPCNFRVLVARPSKAMDVLRENPNGKAFKGLEAAPENEQSSFLVGNTHLKRVCAAVLEKRKQRTPSPQKNRDTDIESWLFSIPKAHATDGDSILNCINMSNGELLDAIENDPELRDYNGLVDQTLAQFQDDLQKQLAAKHNCKNMVSSIPGLYSGAVVKEGDKLHLADPSELRGGDSIFPNISNSVQLGDGLYVSDPVNEAFQNEVKGQMSSAGVNAQFVNTRANHAHKGNLHCATNTVRYCRPRKGGSP